MASVVAVTMIAVHLAGCGPDRAAPAMAVVRARRGQSSVSGGPVGRVVVTAAGKRRPIRLDGRDWALVLDPWRRAAGDAGVLLLSRRIQQRAGLGTGWCGR
jgi:hypothetical protein